MTILGSLKKKPMLQVFEELARLILHLEIVVVGLLECLRLLMRYRVVYLKLVLPELLEGG